MRSENDGAIGVRDGGSCDQDYPTDLRPGHGGPDDAGEGEGAGRRQEVGAMSIRGRHQAVPHKEVHSKRRLLQDAVWVSSTKPRNTLCYFVSTRGRGVPDAIW